MAGRVEYFFDYVSPYTYLADSQLAGLIERSGAELVYRPALLGGVMKATGNSPPATVPAKARYMLTDLQRWTRRYGLSMRFNPHFPVNTIHAMRAALVTLDDGSFPAFHRAMFRAMWEDERDLGDPAVLHEVMKEAGVDADRVAGRIAEQDVKDRLRANTDEAVERGAFGAPTFFVGDEMFWGNDRLDFLEEALRS